MTVQDRNTERSEKKIEEILAEASGQQKKQMDAEGIFVSEELIAATMQKLGQAEENAIQQNEKENSFRQRINHRKQFVRIAMSAAAVFVAVLAVRSGIWLLYNRNSKGFDMDGTGMSSSDGKASDGFGQNGFYQDSVSYPEAIPTEQVKDMNNSSTPPANNHLTGTDGTDFSYLPEYTDTVPLYGQDAGQEAAVIFSIETAAYLSAQSGKEEIMAVLSETEEYLLKEEETSFGSLTESTGIKPWLFCEGSSYSALKIIRANDEALQIVFDYPQDFLYACGREDGCFYLLATRRVPSGDYGHQLLFFDFEAGKVTALPLAEETAGLLSRISLWDGTIAYECEE